jgi:hypothetical protein
MRVLFVIALAACGSACSVHGSAGPSWPRAATHEVDGGESLAPRAAARAIAAIVEDDRAADRAVADKPAAAAAAPAASTGTGDRTVAPAASAPEELMIGEEIVIEVDD